MDHDRIHKLDGINPNDWENLSLADLTHLNCYARDKLLGIGYQIPFVALNMHWAEPLSPAIPDGR